MTGVQTCALPISAADVERRYTELVASVTQSVGVPVAVKIGPNFTSLPNFAQHLVAAGAAGLAAVLGGCTMVGPNFATPEADVARAWATTDAERITPARPKDAAWWKTFDDPTLDQLIDLAYRQNPGLQQAGVNVLRTRAQLGAAIGGQYPQQQEAVGQLLRTNRGSEDLSSLPIGSADRSYSTLQYGVTANWEIDFWGKFRRAIESADQSFLASISNYDAALVSLTATVGTTYVSMRTSSERISVVRENVRIQEQSLAIARARFENGETGERDVTQASSQLAETRAQIPPLEVSLAQSRNALAALVGIPPAAIGTKVTADGPIPRAPSKVAAGIPRDLLRQRPDVRQAEQVAAAESALIGATQADLYPA